MHIFGAFVVGWVGCNQYFSRVVTPHAHAGDRLDVGEDFELFSLNLFELGLPLECLGLDTFLQRLLAFALGAGTLLMTLVELLLLEVVLAAFMDFFIAEEHPAVSFFYTQV